METLISRRISAKAVAAAWKNQYFNGGNWGSTFYGSSKAVYDRLCALPATASRKTIEEIVGGGSWTTGGLCGECDEYQMRLVRFHSQIQRGEDFTVCSSCLKKAVKLLSE